MKSAGARVPRQRGQEMSELYASLRWPLTYHHVEQILDVEVDPMGDRVDKHRVRGGTRTCRRSRPGRRRLPTICQGARCMVLSARKAQADKVEALDAGADDYVTKPFGMDNCRTGFARHSAVPQCPRPVDRQPCRPKASQSTLQRSRSRRPKGRFV